MCSSTGCEKHPIHWQWSHVDSEVADVWGPTVRKLGPRPHCGQLPGYYPALCKLTWLSSWVVERPADTNPALNLILSQLSGFQERPAARRQISAQMSYLLKYRTRCLKSCKVVYGTLGPSFLYALICGCNYKVRASQWCKVAWLFNTHTKQISFKLVFVTVIIHSWCLCHEAITTPCVINCLWSVDRLTAFILLWIFHSEPCNHLLWQPHARQGHPAVCVTFMGYWACLQQQLTPQAKHPAM